MSDKPRHPMFAALGIEPSDLDENVEAEAAAQEPPRKTPEEEHNELILGLIGRRPEEDA